MSPIKMFTYGAVGGCCPTVAKLAATYTTHPETSPPAVGLYFGLALFAILGGIIARGFSTPEVKAALVAGIAAPAIVTNALTGATDPDSHSSSLVTASIESQDIRGSSWIAAAHAQTPAPSPMDPTTVLGAETTVEVTPVVRGGQPNQSGLPFSWHTENDQEIHGQISLQAPQQLAIPPGANSLSILGAEMTIEQLQQQQNRLDIEITTSPTLGGDLLWALGGKRSYQIEQVDIK
ncbi:hypothetical protein PXK00_15325 [Phaeobacter sp. QD34_3]|uniref:hypothetical protein n=1 Tax=unclassified Phaeobacter TaxID=2621772 RepID=UPI00237F2417|nr:MULTISPECIES: hypothetical protein [unclassified Phaeobacter]MDE4134490.1 hypothetical protein [Phaeobacter sp. QD34_3]MDE4138120.1 hypothetical protein [Phaeobacter sp. QD34_24]